ncbi:MAG: ChaN family lipoprotein [Bacteroidota bacterium]
MEAQTYTIYETASGETITLEQVAEACAKADIVFFGEQHDDSIAHALQNELLQLLYAKRAGKVALSMEMFETDVQHILDEYLNDQILESFLYKDARTWSNYETDYKPMVDFAKEKGISVVAANAPRRYVRIVSRNGMEALNGLPKSAKKLLPKLPYKVLEGRYQDKFFDLMGGHGGGRMMNIYHSQNLWDASMANAIFNYWRKHKDELVYHLCGRFHSDEKLGTVKHLLERKSKLNVVTISCFGKDQEDDSPEWYRQLADFVITH